MGRFILIYTHVLILLVHVQMLLALFLHKCPNNLMWTLRAKQLCGVEDKYMCLYDTNERSFRELCKEAPEFHRPGNIFIVSGNLQFFAGRQCNGNRYQPHKWWTNGSSDCQYLKSSCNEEGQVPYDNGTITTDRKCRCDYTNYYTFVNSTRNKCHCDPIEEDCSCYRKRCNEDQVLTPDYDCVGTHEWTGRFVCPEYKHPKITEDKKLPQPTICPDKKKDSSGTIQQSSTRIAVSLLSGALVILSLIVIIRNASKEDIEDVKIKLTKGWRDDHIKLEEKIRKLETEWEEVIPWNIRDQIKRQIQDWEKEDNMCVSTRASKDVMACLQANSCVTLTGPSGVGKSFIARHAALVLRQKGYNIIPVYSPTDLREYYQPGRLTVFIVDDIGGKFTANQQQIENWEQLLPVINTIIADTCCKIIVSCRLQVFNDKMFDVLSPFKLCECNLISDRLALTSLEKAGIAKTYFGTSGADFNNLSSQGDFFPLLCSLYHKKEDVDVNQYFKNPFDVYECELQMLSECGDEGKYKLCSLALCVLFNNQLDEKWFQGKLIDEQRIMVEDLCDAYKITSISKAKLKRALDTLDGTYIFKHDGIYRAVHDKLFDFLAYYFGKKMIKYLIDHGDSVLVHERFIMPTSQDDDKTSNKELFIEIPDPFLQSYLERLKKDWSMGKVNVVFNNTNMKVQSFREKLVEYLRKLKEFEQVTLANTTDTEIHKEEYGSGTTPLIETCNAGYTDMVRWMLHNDVDVDQGRYDWVTGLIIASQNKHNDIIKLLLEKDPNVDLCNKNGCSPLYMASRNGHTDTVKLLLKKDPNVNLCNNNGFSPLCIASQNNHTDTVNVLLDTKPNVNLCNKAGFTPLIQACINNNTCVVKSLLKHKPDINAQTFDGGNALYFSARYGNIELTKLLLKNNANPNVCIHSQQNLKDIFTNQPGYTLDKGKQLCFNSLMTNRSLYINNYVSEKSVEYAFDVVAGSSPLHIACFFGNKDVIGCLLDYYANINIKKDDGTTPLFYACEVGHDDVIRLLLEKGADTQICRLDTKSPLDIATYNGHTSIVMMLTNHTKKKKEKRSC